VVYILRFKLADGTFQEVQTDVLTIWRDDVGFRGEEAMDKNLVELRAGKQTILLDTNGIAAITSLT
jgi:hypothetical protein